MKVLHSHHGNNPIPFKVFNNYQAISQCNNEYMLKYLTDVFLMVGGDKTWINKGLNVVPKKL